MDHCLFVAEQVIRQSRILLKRLSHSRDVSMSEDSKTTGEESVLLAVSLEMLIAKERDYCLCDREASCHKAWLTQDTRPSLD